MDKKVKIILGIAALIVAVVIGFLLYTMREQMIESQQMLEIVEMDKREMENEYEQFAMQYNEMKMQINNDSLVEQLEIEQKRTEELLEELRRVKSSDAAEIMRLKKELATLREVLRSYVLQIDSLNRMNEALTQENTNLKTQNEQARRHISNLSSENESLSDKVAIASQLDATGIYAEGRNKKGKAAKKIKDVKKFVIGFNIARNVTTATGIRSIYVRITTPTGDVLSKSYGIFATTAPKLKHDGIRVVEEVFVPMAAQRELLLHDGCHWALHNKRVLRHLGKLCQFTFAHYLSNEKCVVPMFCPSAKMSTR